MRRAHRRIASAPTTNTTRTRTGIGAKCEKVSRLGGRRRGAVIENYRTLKNPGIARACEYLRCSAYLFSTPTGSRTPVFGLRTRRPGPLDDGGMYSDFCSCGFASNTRYSTYRPAVRPNPSWYKNEFRLSTTNRVATIKRPRSNGRCITPYAVTARGGRFGRGGGTRSVFQPFAPQAEALEVAGDAAF